MQMGLGFADKARGFAKFSLGRNLDFPREVVPQPFESVKGSLIWERIPQAYRNGAVFGGAHCCE